MVVGVLLGAAVETFVPEETFTHYLGGASLLGLLAALVIAAIFSADSPGMLRTNTSRCGSALYTRSTMHFSSSLRPDDAPGARGHGVRDPDRGPRPAR
jgi:hypothetical protein